MNKSKKRIVNIFGVIDIIKILYIHIIHTHVKFEK